MKTISSIKTYPSNIDVFRVEGYDSFTLYSDNYFGETVHESEVREHLTDSYGLTQEDIDEIVSVLYTMEWILADDEVYIYKVHHYQTYRADEQGVRYEMDKPGPDTAYYKCEYEREKKRLPEGFRYEEMYYKDGEGAFIKDGIRYVLVNENGGTVSLVSTEGIVKWF